MRILTTWVTCGALFAACGGSSDDSSGGSSGPVSIDQLPTALANAYCAVLAPCCQSVGVPVNATSCRSFLEQNFKESYASADPANYEYDAAAAGQCVDSLRALGGNCGGFTMAFTPSTSCNQFIQGRLAPGATCASDIECAGQGGEEGDCEIQQECTDVNGTFECVDGEGICVVEPRGAAGDECYWTCTDDGNGGTSCSGSGTEETPTRTQCFTNDGLYCSSETGVCTAQASLGGACTQDDGCTEGLRCDSAIGTCAARAAAGGACFFDSDCADGLYCKDDVCVPELAPGSACDELQDECRDGSCDNGTCSESTGDLGDAGLALACVFLTGGFPTQE